MVKLLVLVLLHRLYTANKYGEYICATLLCDISGGFGKSWHLL